MLTAENADTLILEYFSPGSLYEMVYPDKGSPYRVPCDPPSVAGFCSKWDIPPSRLATMLTPDTIELCQAKLEHILTVNGLTKGYDSSLTGLVAKNKLGWTDKLSTVSTTRAELAPEDIKLLAEMGLVVSGPQAMKVIDNA